MSKSEGTSYTVDDVIKHGYNPLVLRFFFLQAHYRSKQNFTWDALEASNIAYHKLLTVIQNIDSVGLVNPDYKKLFVTALEDDFNTSSALALMFDLLKDQTVSDADKKATILDFDKVLGLDLHLEKQKINIPKHITELAEKRLEAKKRKDWEKADALRLEISGLGYTVLDTKEGFTIELQQ
jgi:cysteinyl-tRNA synthetase